MRTNRLKIILFLFAVCLVGAGVWYFSNIWKGDETQTQAAQNLKLLTSHSQPEAGDKWVVSFETMGNGDLTITPTDQDTIGDLDFASMKCAPSDSAFVATSAKEAALAKEGFGQEVNPEIQAGDVLFVPNWSCDGVGIVAHLVNIARKHTLKFQFGNKVAYAYNNPDSITDSFDANNPGGNPEYYIASKSNITVASGQVKLSTLKANGESCSSGTECESTFCIDSVCCNSICNGTPCYRCDSYSYSGAGTCDYVSTAVDPDSECPGAFGTCASTTCSGSGYSCGYLSGQQACSTCYYCNGSSYSCVYAPINTQQTLCTGCRYCNATGICLTCAYVYSSTLSNCESWLPERICKPSAVGTTAYDSSGCGGWSKHTYPEYTCTVDICTCQ